MHGRLTSLLAVAIVCASSCASERAAVSADVHTDLVPGVEFDRIELRIGTQSIADPARAIDYVETPARIGELMLDPGPVTVEVAAYRGAEVVLGRSVRLTVRGTSVVPVWLLRTCLGITCPGAGDAASATECEAGRCVDPGCEGSSCVLTPCTVGGDCPAPPARCARAVCIASRCATQPILGECAASEVCSPITGCEPRPGLDAGMPDASTCVAGGVCSVPNPCAVGRIECSTGAPLCTEAGPGPAGTTCRASAGDCDVEEACDGVSTNCPPDSRVPAGTECRASALPCDAAELCDGSTTSCPVDGPLESGCSSAFRTEGTTTFVVPSSCTRLRVRAWGAGGGFGRRNAISGAGGYAEAVIDAIPGESLTVVVGAPGHSSLSTAGGLGGIPGGGRGGNSSSDGGGGGGGYSGVFRGGMTLAEALLVAGGGAGSGGGATRPAGAGGGAVGQQGQSVGSGGTATAGGLGSGGGTNGSALLGGNGGSQASGDGGGGGGGGYFGGGGGPGADTDAGGGGGGSAFAVPSASAVTLTAGTGSTPAGLGDVDRMGAGDELAPGAVLLECL